MCRGAACRSIDFSRDLQRHKSDSDASYTSAAGLQTVSMGTEAGHSQHLPRPVSISKVGAPGPEGQAARSPWTAHSWQQRYLQVAWHAGRLLLM